jgi:hypothetical protein
MITLDVADLVVIAGQTLGPGADAERATSPSISSERIFSSMERQQAVVAAHWKSLGAKPCAIYGKEAGPLFGSDL